MQTELTPLAAVVDYHRAAPLFDDRPVPVNILAQILDAGHMALSGSSFEPGRFLLLHTPNRKAALRRAFGHAEVTNAPVVIAAIAEEPWLKGHVLQALAELTLTAERVGYDTFTIQGFDPAAVRQELGLLGGSEVVGLVAIGRLLLPLQRNWRAS